jgi:NifU-like protein involved in Fe-S cluster formation
MNYSDLTRRHFESAAAAGVLAGPGVTWVQFDVQVGSSDHAATIEAVRFLAFGCPHVIAVSDWISQAAVGRQVTPVLPESVQALRERFDVPVEKLGRLLIIEDAWIAAVSSPYRACEGRLS